MKLIVLKVADTYIVVPHIAIIHRQMFKMIK